MNDGNSELQLDVSVQDQARALHRVWRALNDGDCPKCHNHFPAHTMKRDSGGIQCPGCSFTVTHEEIWDIELAFAPFMNKSLEIFERWRAGRSGVDAVACSSVVKIESKEHAIAYAKNFISLSMSFADNSIACISNRQLRELLELLVNDGSV